MKNRKQRFCLALGGSAAAALFSAGLCMTAFAMNVSVSFSDPSAQVGEDVTVAMHVVSTSGEPLGTANIMLNYDASALEFVSGDNTEGGAGSLRVSGQATTDAKEWYYGLRFRALTGGSSDISIATAEIYDANAKIAELAHKGSAKVTVGTAGQSESTAQAALSALSISPGTLSPVFSPEQSNYTAVVGDAVTRIAVSAVPAAGDAKVTVSGNEALELGENMITVNVSGEDGTALGSYAITVTKQEGETPTEAVEQGAATVTLGDTLYEIAGTFDAALLPEGYTAGEYSYDGRAVLAGSGPDAQLHLMYLLTADGNGDLFLYDEGSKSWSPYVEVGMSAKAVTVIPLGADVTVPAELVSSQLNLNGKSVDGWIGTKDQGENYCVFYGMNAEGQKGFYRFDLAEKTIQRYFSERTAEDVAREAAAAQEMAELQKKYRRRTRELMAAAAVALAAVIAAVAMALRKRSAGTVAAGDGFTERAASAENRFSEYAAEADGLPEDAAAASDSALENAALPEESRPESGRAGEETAEDGSFQMDQAEETADAERQEDDEDEDFEEIEL